MTTITITPTPNGVIGSDALALIEGVGTMPVRRREDGSLGGCWPCEPRSAEGGSYPGAAPAPHLSEGQGLLAQALYSRGRDLSWPDAVRQASGMEVELLYAEGPRRAWP